jgi:hypothetical protein
MAKKAAKEVNYTPGKEAVALYQRLKAKGYKSKFDPDIHIPMLMEHFAEGKDVMSFCATAEMCRDNFYEWIDNYPEFSKAYDQAKDLAFRWFEKQAKDGMTAQYFNQSLWSLMMKNRFGYTTERKIRIKKLKDAETPMEQFKVIKEEVAEGNLTASETTNMATFVATGATILEKTEVVKRLESIEERLLSKDDI